MPLFLLRRLALRPGRPRAVLCLALVALAGCAVPAPAPAPAPEPLELAILHVNDSHSRLDGETLNLRLRNAAGVRESISVDHGGFPRVVAAIRQRAAASPHVLTLHAGDALTGDLYHVLTEGRAEAEQMNAVCFDAFTLGNHEFDGGDAGLKKFIGFLHGGTCRTPVLSANTRFGPASPLAGAGSPVQASTVVRRGGHRIGIVGVTIADKTMNASRPGAGTVIGDELAAAQAAIDALRAQGIDKIVLLTHLGHGFDLAIAPRLSGVDVIVGGDSHTLLGPAALKDIGLSTAGDYPARARDRDGKPVCIVQAWQYASVLGELKVGFDARGEVTRCDGTPHLLVGASLRRGQAPVNPADAAAMRAELAATGAVLAVEPDPAALALLQPHAQAKAAFGAQVIGQAQTDLCLRRVPGTRLDPTRSTLGAACDRARDGIAHGGDIQQLVAQAFLAGAREYFPADLSLQNGGGVRADLKAGPVTVRDVYTVLPFKNTLVQLQATGAQVKDALEDALDAVVTHKNTGGYPYAGALRFDVDLTRPKGSRVSRLQLRQGDGRYVPLEPARIYRVATTNFLADGGDYYATLKTLTGERRSDVGLDYAQVLLRYFQAQPGNVIRKLPLADYSTQGFVDLP